MSGMWGSWDVKRFDGLDGVLLFGEIVHDHDFAELQRRAEHLLDIG